MVKEFIVETLIALLEVSSDEPEEARRRRLLNLLLLGVAAMTLTMGIALVVTDSMGLAGGGVEVIRFYIAIGFALLSIIIVYLLNRYGSGTVASSLFLLLLTYIIVISDEPMQVIEGYGRAPM